MIPQIAVDMVTRTYRAQSGKEVRALDSVTFAIPKSAFAVVMGASGSGKSSLLHVLGGLLRVETGTVIVGGRNLTQMSDSELARYRLGAVGFVFQSFHLLSHLTAWENVALPLVAAGVCRADRRSRAVRMLEALDLGSHRDHRPTELSGGEQQRVALARATVNSPELILADEPTGNLDGTNANIVLSMLKAFVEERQATVVCATHDERIARQADLVIQLRNGRVTGE